MADKISLPEPIAVLPDGFSIRQYHISDGPSCAHYSNNRNIWLNLGNRMPYPNTLSDAEWWINHALDRAEVWLPTISAYDKPADETQESFDARREASKVPCHYAVCLDNKCVGSVGVEFSPGRPKSVAIGYWIGEPFWGKGFMTMLAKAWVEYIWKTWPYVVRIEGDAFGWNKGSQKVLQKIGMTYEGTKKLAAFKDDKYGDVICYGMTRPGFVPVLMDTGDNP